MGANSSRSRYEYGYGDQAYDPYSRARKREMAAGNPYYRQPMGMIPAGYPVMQPPIVYPQAMQQPFQQFAGQPMVAQLQPGAAGMPIMPQNPMPVPQMQQFQNQPMPQPQPQLPLSTGPQYVQQQGVGAANPAAFFPRQLSRRSSTSSSDYDSRERRRRRRRRRRRSWESDPLGHNPLPAPPRESDVPDSMLAGTAMAPRGPPLPRRSSPLRNPLPPPPKDVYTLRKYRKLLIGSDYAHMEKEVYPRGWFSDDEGRDSDSGLGRVFERLNPFRSQRESSFSPGHRRHETMSELPRLPEFDRERSGSMSESTDVSPPMRRPMLGRSFSSRIPFMRRRRRDEGAMPPLDHSLARITEGPEPPVGFMAHSPAVPGPTTQPQPAHPLSPMTSGPEPAHPFSPDQPEPRQMVPNSNPGGMPEPVIPTNQGGMPVPGHPLTPGPPPQPANPLTPGPPPAHPLTPGPPPMGMPIPGMSQSMSMPMPDGPRSMGMPEPGGPPPMNMLSPAMPQGMPMSAYGEPPPLGMPTPGAPRSMGMPTPRGSQSMAMPEPGVSQPMGMPAPGHTGPTAARPLSPFIPPLVAGEGPAFSRSRSGSHSDATPPVIYFDQNTPGYGGLCHLSPHRVLYRKKLYPTAAHLFEAFRFLGSRDDLASRVRKAQTFPELNEVLHSIEQYTRPDWETIFLDKMEEALYCKIAQHEELCDLLLDTGDAELIYADPNDMVWGEGEDGEGVNELGRALMRVRDRLRREAVSPF